MRRPLARRTAPFALAALATPAALLLASPASAAPPTSRDVSAYACNPGLVPAPGFADVPADYTFAREIACLAGYGFTQGKTATTYGPAERVSRAQMAVFVYNLGRYAGAKFDTSDAGFTDIGTLPKGYRDAINALANAKVVQGTSGTTYSPGQDVTRGQLATYLNGLQKFVSGSGFAAGHDEFNDDGASVHESDINAVAGAGIVSGTGDGSYGPAGSVGRGQMARFLVGDVDADVALGLLASKYPGGAASFPATPAGEIRSDYSSGDTAGQQKFTVVTDAAKTVSLALLPAENIRVDAGVVTVRDATPGGSARFVDVNGASASGTQVDGVTPKNGTVTFTIDSSQMDEVVPIAWADLDGDKKLDLVSQLPAEPVGVAARVDYTPPEASAGPTSITVMDAAGAVNPRLDYLVSAGTPGDPVLGGGTPPATYLYDSGDKLGYNGQQFSVAVFEGLLSAGDALNVNYQSDPAPQSAFNVTSDAVPAPGDVTAVGSGSSVTLSWTPSAQADAVYDVFRDGETTPLQRVDGTTVTLTSQPDGSHTYTVQAVGGYSKAAGGKATSNAVMLPVGGPRTVPSGSLVDADKPFRGVLDSGDVLAFYFDQPVSVAADATLSLSNGAKQTGQLTNGGNATFAVNADKSGLFPAGAILTVTVNAPVRGSDGETVSLNGLTGTAASGVTGTNGAWNGVDKDAAIEDNGPELVRTDAQPGVSTFLVDANEALNPSSANDMTNYTYTSASGTPVLVTGATLQPDGRTVQVQITGSVSSGDTLTANLTDTDGQAASSTIALG